MGIKWNELLKYDINSLVCAMLKGDTLSLAKLITVTEAESENVPEIVKAIYPHIGNAYRLGVTGPPGAGKSTILDKLISFFRANKLSVGVICADPSSPFTGGAVLGDRIRMQSHIMDEGVFIRSMATRGSLGGLPKTTSNVIKLLEAFGKEIILVETVGVGQAELDIMEIVDTTIVVLVPEAGDSIQAMKAGLMEIADIFVVNKADRPGVESFVRDLITSVHLCDNKNSWERPILTAEAINNIGIDHLYEQIEKHNQTIRKTGQFNEKRMQHRRKEFIEAIEKKAVSKLLDLVERDTTLAEYLSKVDSGIFDAYSAADAVIRKGFIRSWANQLLNNNDVKL